MYSLVSGGPIGEAILADERPAKSRFRDRPDAVPIPTNVMFRYELEQVLDNSEKSVATALREK